MSKTRFTKDKEIVAIFDKMKSNEKERDRLDKENYDLLDKISALVYEKILADKLLSTVTWRLTTMYGGCATEIISTINDKEWKPIIELITKTKRLSWSYHERLQLTDKICLSIDDGTATLKVMNVNPHKREKFHSNKNVKLDIENQDLLDFIKENGIKIETQTNDHLEVAKADAIAKLQRIEKVIATVNEINNHSA